MIKTRALLNKWLSDYGFNMDVILHICKKLKKKPRFSFEKLDTVLTKYYEMKLFSIMEIDDFEKEKDKLYALAKEINKTIGVYYENLEGIVENYILKWINMGFDHELLIEIALYCFKTSIRTLEGMDKTVNKLFKLGILNVQAFHQYMNEVLKEDSKIRDILTHLGIERNVNYIDRANYNVWKDNWKMSDELIEYATTLAKGKDSPIKYLSKVLSDWHDKGIKNIEEAKNTSPVGETVTNSHNFTGRSYTREELNALFQSIDEFDV